MAFRTWGRLLLTALGVSLLAGAGQLGVAFGFGIVRLTGSFTGGSVNQWPAQLVWAGWFAANAAVAGAVLTERLARRDGLLTGTVRPVAVAAAAALGATVVAPLCMQPARAAELISVDPVWAVAVCATAGAVVGAGAATAVLLRPSVGWNMALVAAAVWVLALVSAAPTLFRAGPLSTVRLGVLEPSWLDPDAAQRLSLLVLPTVALLAGAATGGLARWRGHPPLVSGATGVAGPVLLAFAYLTAGPGDAVDRYQTTPYYGALIAVAVGALGSAAAALLRWPLLPVRTTSTAIEPTEVLRALPAGPALPSAARSADAPSATTPSATPPSDGAGVVPTEHLGGTPVTTPARLSGPGAPVSISWDWPVPTSTSPADADPRPVPVPATADHAVSTPPAGQRPADVPARDEPGHRPTDSTDMTTDVNADVNADVPTASAVPTGRDTEASVTAPAGTIDRPTFPAPADGGDGAATEAQPVTPPATDAATNRPIPTNPASATASPLPADPPRRAGDGGSPEPAPRPRHRSPLPDLGRAATWDAFGTVHRAGPTPSDDTAVAPATDTSQDLDGTSDAGTLTPAVPSVPLQPGMNRGTDGGDTTTGDTATGSDTGTPESGRARGRRGLFRRGKARADQNDTDAADRGPAPLPAQDEEFVDWVAGLSKPLADNEPERESGRRSLRSSGRHHRD